MIFVVDGERVKSQNIEDNNVMRVKVFSNTILHARLLNIRPI